MPIIGLVFFKIGLEIWEIFLKNCWFVFCQMCARMQSIHITCFHRLDLKWFHGHELKLVLNTMKTIRLDWPELWHKSTWTPSPIQFITYHYAHNPTKILCIHHYSNFTITCRSIWISGSWYRILWLFLSFFTTLPSIYV